MNSMEAQNAFHGILQIKDYFAACMAIKAAQGCTKDYLGPGEWLVLGCQGDQVVSRAIIVGHLSMGAALREKGRHTLPRLEKYGVTIAPRCCYWLRLPNHMAASALNHVGIGRTAVFMPHETPTCY